MATGNSSLKASGFVVWRRERGRVLYLTLTNARHGDVGFPKGHAQPGEDDRATAVRETREETGLDARPNAWFKRTITYEAFGKPKEVVYLLGTCDSFHVELSTEHNRHAWLDLDDTVAALRHEALRDVVRDAAIYVKDPILRRGLDPASAKAMLLAAVGADAPLLGHTSQVAQIARTCADAWGQLDSDYVEAAAWLHDIGRSKTHGLRHPLEGFRIAVESGFAGYGPPCLSHYTKGRSAEELGLTKDFAREMWEACDLDTFHVEERLIAMADLMAVGSKRGTMEERHEDLVRRYGPSPFFDGGYQRGLELKREFEARAGVDLYSLILSS